LSATASLALLSPLLALSVLAAGLLALPTAL
jgi:hypothetical protein